MSYDPYLSNPHLGTYKWARFSLRELIKNHAIKLLWGRGYTLRGKDRKVIEEILNSIKGEMFFPSSERVKFDQGHAIVVIRSTLTGDNLEELQKHLDLCFDNTEWELEFNRTVVFIGMTPQEQEEVKREIEPLHH